MSRRNRGTVACLLLSAVAALVLCLATMTRIQPHAPVAHAGTLNTHMPLRHLLASEPLAATPSQGGDDDAVAVPPPPSFDDGPEPVLEPSYDEVQAINRAKSVAKEGWYALREKLDDCKFWSVSLTTVASPVSPLIARDVESHIIMSPEIIARTAPEILLDKFLLSADPFLYRHWQADEGAWVWYLFFEGIKDSTPVIAWARQQPGDTALEQEFRYGGLVTGLEGLNDKCGFSYPYVIRGPPGTPEANQAYMLPSSSCARDPLKLYAAKVFPDVWEPVSTLMSCNPKCGDSDMVYWQGHWYLFVGTNNRQQGMGHQRTLYFADSVRGPFKKHPSSPLRIVGKSFGRGAGRMVTWGDHYIVRYSQHYVNGEHRYGDYVVASVITELSPTSIKIKYSKDWVINTPLKHRVAADSTATAWNAAGVHHVDMHPLSNGTWLAVFDGRELCGVTKRRAFHLCWQYRFKRGRGGKNGKAACREVCAAQEPGNAPIECLDGTFSDDERRRLRAPAPTADSDHAVQLQR